MDGVKKRASFFNIEKIKELLQESAAGDEMAEQMLSARNGILLNFLCEEMGSAKSVPREQVIPILLSSMAGFIRSYRTMAGFRQRVWDCCNLWLARMAEQFGVEYSEEDLEAECPKPVMADRGVCLAKALHDSAGKTKEDLAMELGVSPKSIQNDLRALDPSLAEKSAELPTIRVAGQLVNLKIDWKTKEFGKKYFHTEERMHPILLQLNTAQLHTLMKALQTFYDQYDSGMSRMMATEIWSQVSSPAAERIREVYSSLEPELMDFLKDVESEFGQLPPFQTEAEMADNLSNADEWLGLAFKSEKRYSLTLRVGDEKRIVKNQRIVWLGSNQWLAVPVGESIDSPNAIRFTPDDLCGYLERL